MKKLLKRVVLPAVFSIAILLPACSKSPLTGWEYRPYEGGPPSWENDYGRPIDDYGGEDPWT